MVVWSMRRLGGEGTRRQPQLPWLLAAVQSATLVQCRGESDEYEISKVSKISNKNLQRIRVQTRDICKIQTY